MRRFIRYELVTVWLWFREKNKILLLTEDGQQIEYLGTQSLSQLWLRGQKGKTICAKIVENGVEEGFVLD